MVTVTSSANPSTYRQRITLTATVTLNPGPGTPTGCVTFTDGSTTLGTRLLESGVAAFSTATLTVGAHSILASYSPNLATCTGNLDDGSRTGALG